MVEVKDIDFIQGNKFATIADFTFSPTVKHQDDYYNLPNTLNLWELKDINIVFTTPFYAKALFNLIAPIHHQFIVITHNGDNRVDDNGVAYMDGRGNYVKTDYFVLPDNVIKWYATNVNTIHPRIEAIPSGLENDKWNIEKRKKEKMIAMLSTPKNIRNLVYLDHSTTWNTEDRLRPYEILEDKSWATALRKGPDFDRFLDNLYNHIFVICPRGNGIATHREWEALYMGTIPIQRRDRNNRFFTELPICFVDEWEEITEEFLNAEYKRIRNNTWRTEMLTFAYWKNKILNTKE
jgi:hypothetical protein